MDHNTHNHDEIHLPPPSVAPIIVAGGVTFTLVGLLNLPLFIVGIIMLFIGLAMWAFNRG
jgi:hypothetical protein